MKPAAIGASIGVVLIAFVTVWVYMASQKLLPNVGGQLQDMNWGVRVGALVVLVALLGFAFTKTRK